MTVITICIAESPLLVLCQMLASPECWALSDNRGRPLAPPQNRIPTEPVQLSEGSKNQEPLINF